MPKPEDVKPEAAQEDKAAAPKAASVSKSEDTDVNFPELQSLESEVNSTEDAPNSEEQATDKKSESDSNADSEVAAETNEEIDPEVIQALIGDEEPKPEDKKPVPIENRIAELERKNREYAEQLKVAQAPPVPQISEEQMDELFQKDFPNFSPQQCRDLVKFMNGYVTEFVKPSITKEIEQKTQKNQYRENIKADKLYKLVEKDIDDIAKNDEFISSLPEERKWKQALKEAVLRKLPTILKNHSVKARKAAESNKSLIPSEKGIQATPKAKVSIPQLTEWDKRYLKKHGKNLKEADLHNPNYQGKTVIED